MHARTCAAWITTSSRAKCNKPMMDRTGNTVNATANDMQICNTQHKRWIFTTAGILHATVHFSLNVGTVVWNSCSYFPATTIKTADKQIV
eukprot:m.1669395 g.1669395  ORF g.1669395 m.1669395 type:complete len:90 (-) comp158045_c0_seq1:35-304(-)